MRDVLGVGNIMRFTRIVERIYVLIICWRGKLLEGVKKGDLMRIFIDK